MAEARAEAQSPEEDKDTVCYVYGIVPADVATDERARGVGDSPVETVMQGKIAALVSLIPHDTMLGQAEDLVAHERLLDLAAAETPVLPFRFGSVMSSEHAVRDELLAPYHDEFLSALSEFEGRREFVVHARYVEETILREVLTENEEAARLHERIRAQGEEADQQDLVALGELIFNAIAAKREADSHTVAEAIAPLSVSIAPRDPRNEDDAVNIAFLVGIDHEQEFRAAVEEIAENWTNRVGLRLLGPLAPYDFATSRTTPEE
ncbi:GvpL/GvpF family gas vesicle protein [Lentzea terrae]|uniref:GvpL/GvpF family gas vesicle protein n=1 Tax=Lentzea terrae TaxID=2200761 RepID=UPI000DD413D5|nr:GvpL/GvpF family gas vesicle protein [Lentzea terrae]